MPPGDPDLGSGKMPIGHSDQSTERRLGKDKATADIGNLGLWLQVKKESILWRKVAANCAPAFRNGDSDDRRLKPRFDNVDRSSVSLPVETGSLAASFLAGL